jgi:hypothetical protein
MDKCYPSRGHASRSRALALTTVFSVLATALVVAALKLAPADAQRIGRKIWQNECNGTIAGLTSWNAGEDFASLGIGHFIWYPEGKPGPFEESFPPLVAFISSHGTRLPTLLSRPGPLHCPWKSREDFMLAQPTTDMKQLRQFLADTVDLQTQFMINRLDAALPKMLTETSASSRAPVQTRFQRLAGSPNGCYALIDYVNFKGEGVLRTERYGDQGWGLLQVLEQMQDGPANAVEEFSRAAAAVLARRVHNAPPSRKESRWLSGWIHRVNSYSRGS